MQSASTFESSPQLDQLPDQDTIRALKTVWDRFRDPEEFIENALVVQKRQGQLVPFLLKKKQREFVADIRAKRLAGIPIRKRIPKTRRVGMSTVIAALIFQETPFFEGQSALILAHEKKAARNLFGYYNRFEQNYKPFLGIGLPGVRGRTASQDSGSITWVNRSSIEIATAKNLDFSRSFDFRFLHLSEAAFYRSLRGLMTALAATVADDPGTMIFEESTCNGYNDFHAACMASLEGRSDYELFFVGCFDDEENWREFKHADPVKFEQSLTDDEWALQERYDLVLEQLYWRRKKLEEYMGDQKRFDQEFPHSLEVAFQSSGRQRFNPQLFVWMPTATPFERCELEHQQERGKDIIVPTPHQYGELSIWKRPELHGQYIGGVDVAKGVDINEGNGTADPDWCVAEIGERRLGEQVAELHTRLEPTPFAAYLYDLGRYYNWAYYVIECEFSGGNGRAVIVELLRLGYPPERLYHHEELEEGTAKRTTKPGFEIRPNTRPLLINNHDRYLRQRGLILHSRMAISEHLTFVKKNTGSGNVKIEHEQNCHDDLVFGSMYLTWGFEHAPVFQSLRSEGRRDLPLPTKWGQGPPTQREVEELRRQERRERQERRFRT